MKNTIPSLAPGEKYVYHTGFLSRDVGGDYELQEARNQAFKMYEGGKAVLFQKKISPGSADTLPVYEYMAIGISPESLRKLDMMSPISLKKRVSVMKADFHA
jgi:hypothetical protein